MTSVVTGGAGFIGGHLADRLVRDGETVSVIDDFRSGSYVAPGARLYPVSVADASPAIFDGVETIFHLASPVGPVGVLRRTGRIASEVVADADRLGTIAQMTGARLVYVSTSELYGPQTGSCSEELNRVIAPGSSARMEYAVAKLAAETMLLNRDIDVRIVRPFNVAGPRQRPDGGFVIPRFVRQAINRTPLTVYAPGTQVRAFGHVLDVVAGIVAVRDQGRAGTVYNIGNPANRTTNVALAERVLRRVWPDGEWSIVEPETLWGPAFREAADKYPDISFAQTSLGWTPLRSLDEIIDDAYHGTLAETRKERRR